VHFGHSRNSYIFAVMFRRALAVCLFLLSYSSVFGQEKFTVQKDLRSEWMSFAEGGYKPLADVPFTGLNTIYFSLDPHAHPDGFLRLRSDRPYFLFVNGTVVGEYEQEVRLNIDSLSRQVKSAGLWIAIHQNRINERDLLTEIISMEPALQREAEYASRPYWHFRDFVVVSGLVIVLLFLLALRLNPKLAADYFSISRIFSSREADDSQTSARLTSSSNVQFYVLCSLMMGFYLLIILNNLPAEYALPIRFESSGFWMLWWNWLKLSTIVFYVLLLKIFIIFLLTRLFGMRGMARFHFFNWIRLLLVVFGSATILLFIYFISRGTSPNFFVVFLSLIVVVLVVWIVVAFYKLTGRSGHSMFHLFSYLCATEIIPLLITVKVLFQ
jgi:hypothetical protein